MQAVDTPCTGRSRDASLPIWSPSSSGSCLERRDLTCYAETFESLTAHLDAGYLERRLPELALPALIVHGRRDPIPYWSAEQTAALILDVSLEPIEDCGHLPWLEQPGELRGHVAGLLATH